MRILQYRFATRISRAPVLFLDELFRVSTDPSVISFASGLPSAALIDTGGIARAKGMVLEEEGAITLQYSTSDGYFR